MFDFKVEIKKIVENSKSKIKVENKGKKIVVSTLNKIRYSMLDFNLSTKTNVDLYKKYQLDEIHSILNKRQQFNQQNYESNGNS